ncbi:unnamed protein product [Brassica rapa]|uniref:Uncharacterized protein n=1 Tax=Brassica campestris TaxID=3711 RepID=A0A8D9CTH9_BRACM|nr:unnamed protein product [Brassica rapa]
MGSDQSKFARSILRRKSEELSEARGGSVRVQISLSRPVNFFMVKPRLCPRQDQSSPVQSSLPSGFGQVLSDQPAASRLEHCELQEDDSVIIQVIRYEDDCGGLEEDTQGTVVDRVKSIREAVEKNLGLIAGRKFTGRTEIGPMDREARGGSLHEFRTWCQLSSKLSVYRSLSQTCGARGAAVHASGAMRSDTRAATNLNLIGWCLL